MGIRAHVNPYSADSASTPVPLRETDPSKRAARSAARVGIMAVGLARDQSNAAAKWVWFGARSRKALTAIVR
jgi:hypothetical protein